MKRLREGEEDEGKESESKAKMDEEDRRGIRGEDRICEEKELPK